MTRGVRLYCSLVGAVDTVTGLLLLIVPLLTLRMMFVRTMPAEPLFVRFIGVFVASVGVMYLYPFLGRSRGATDARLQVVLETTTIVRGGVATFLLVAVLAGALEPAWSVVLVSDGLLAVVQGWILAQGLADAR